MVGLAEPSNFPIQFTKLIRMSCMDKLMENNGLATDTLLTFIYKKEGQLLDANDMVQSFIDGRPVLEMPVVNINRNVVESSGRRDTPAFFILLC